MVKLKFNFKKTPFGQGVTPRPKGHSINSDLPIHLHFYPIEYISLLDRQALPHGRGEEAEGILFLLGFAQHFLKEGVIQHFAFCNILAVFDEIDDIHACNLLGVERTKPQEGLAHHVGG